MEQSRPHRPPRDEQLLIPPKSARNNLARSIVNQLGLIAGWFFGVLGICLLSLEFSTGLYPTEFDQTVGRFILGFLGLFISFGGARLVWLELNNEAL